MSDSFTVSELNKYLNGLMKADPVLRDVNVRGEISNFRPHYSGHLYFTLKDSACALRCVMFRSAASRVPFKVENGMKVLAKGGVSVFERDGLYQLYCEELHADGVGDLYVAFEQLKRKLADEGLFNAARKVPPPRLPEAVCVVTSPTGSVVRDIINVSLRRFPNAVLKIYPVQVQGAGAAQKIARAVADVNARGLADLIIVARGGGSLEDLWAFNEEELARAVAASRIPVISAVGHETDFTICDFVADLRAPTPSAAAELAFPEAAAIAERLAGADRALRGALRRRVELARLRLERCRAARVFTKPAERLEFARLRVNAAEEKLAGVTRAAAERSAARVAVLCARLEALSPLAVLARGYAVVTDFDGAAAIRSAGAVAPGDEVNVRLHEGSLRCEVLSVK